MNESEFLAQSDQIFTGIVASLDAADVDLDPLWQGNVLEMTCPDESKIIVNRHAYNRELWVAAKSGGYHFAWKGEAWIDTRSNEPFFEALTRVIFEQCGVIIKI